MAPPRTTFSLLMMYEIMHAAFSIPYTAHRGQCRVFLEQELTAHIWSNVSIPLLVAFESLVISGLSLAAMLGWVCWDSCGTSFLLVLEVTYRRISFV